jgi:hypothetical protein
MPLRKATFHAVAVVAGAGRGQEGVPVLALYVLSSAQGVDRQNGWLTNVEGA